MYEIGDVELSTFNKLKGVCPMNKDIVLRGNVVTPYRVIENGMVIVRGDRILYAGEENIKQSENISHILDFREGTQYIVPGFIDIHCHGGGGVACYDDPETFARFHLQHGTTSILPTLVYNQSHQSIIASLQHILSAMAISGSSIVGVHMEGPYINPNYGAITSPIRPVNRQEYQEILELAGTQIKIWTLAPELDGQRQFMEEASTYNIVFSVGHSEATPETIFESVRLGLRLGCHLTNASGTTPSISRYEGTREVGVHEAVMVHDEIFAEVIPDAEGIHVRPLMLKLILKAKGANQVVIITDATEQAGIGGGRDVNMIRANEHTPGEQGEEILAGSLLTMDRAVYNMMRHTGVGMVDACKMASLNPARVIGMDRDLGSLECGKKANLLVVSQAMQVHLVMLEGNIVVQNPHGTFVPPTGHENP